jgi:uncharacterized SAM-binding protein YcdF (DUF218 family)
MHNKQLSNIYSTKVIGNCIKKPLYLRVLGEADEKIKKYSKRELAIIIAAEDPNLTVGSCKKDTRIQPKVPYEATKFMQTLRDAKLSIVKIVKPGEDGSTSSLLRTYIVQDENENEYPVVLGKGKGFGTRDENFVLDNLKEQIKSLLINNGIKNENINVIDDNGAEFQNTYDLIVSINKLVSGKNINRIILVASPEHLLRLKSIWKKINPKMEVLCFESKNIHGDEKYNHNYEKVYITIRELVALAYYKLVYKI